MPDELSLRLRLIITGAVQGVGFRPFVYRVATEMNLAGWVSNSTQGLIIEAEGPPAQVECFRERIGKEKPPHARIENVTIVRLPALGAHGFEIRASDLHGSKTTLILPDMATCADCVRDITEPANRRFRYPFTNCTNCGPRFSIIEALPYDRPTTTMKRFRMCSACQREYDDPQDRRFHAQPNACPQCGPHLELWDGHGQVLATHHEALLQTAQLLRAGQIAAVKGLGGFHLMVDARDARAVNRLRQRKRREEKPFALMMHDLDTVRHYCTVSELEVKLLLSAEAPIVLLRRQASGDALPDGVAPGNPYLGVLLPYTPLHHLLMAELDGPVVATSGNRSDEPICTDEHEALCRLAGLADVFLIHNRPIARHVDDSIVHVLAGRETVFRRARGYAPLPVHLAETMPPVLAVGAHLKNTVAVSVGRDVFVSQHIGDLETPEAFAAFEEVQGQLRQLYEQQPVAVVCDLHPDYRSTQFARASGLPVIAVQHHEAHVLSCMAENHLSPPVLGVSWDGTGYGTDGYVWGGEFFVVSRESIYRFGHLRTFRLPGADQAVREPRRSAVGLLYEHLGDSVFARDDLPPIKTFRPDERRVLRSMLQRGFNSPHTSSAGRLFDALAALVGLRQITHFEGQAAMALEFATDGFECNDVSEIDMPPAAGPLIIDWGPLVQGVLADIAAGLAVGRIACKVHNTLVEAIVTVAKHAAHERVILTGGCFQNRYLTERAVERLHEAGFQPFWHRHVPPNDGGIALGQVLGAARALSNR